jgi:hypothetical protein
MFTAAGSSSQAGGRMTSMVEVLPPHLPLELELPADSGETLQLLKGLWLRATAESIGRDVQLAKELAASAPAPESELAHRYVIAIARLERWLRDF